MTTKPALRQTYQAKLRTLSAAEKTTAAEKLCAHLHAQNFAADKIIAGYWPLPAEISVLPFMAQTANPTALPIVTAKDAPLSFGLWRAGDVLGKNILGLPAPITAPLTTPDILLVPGLAFSTAGARLGRGGGFYDRTLKSLRATKSIMAIGVGFACQLAVHLPIEEHDETLDLIITDAGVITTSRP